MSRKPRDEKTKGLVIRLKPSVMKYLSDRRKPGESWSDLVIRLQGIGAKPLECYVLPTTLRGFRTAAEARGAGVVEQVAFKLTEPVRPVRVREVL